MFKYLKYIQNFLINKRFMFNKISWGKKNAKNVSLLIWKMKLYLSSASDGD